MQVCLLLLQRLVHDYKMIGNQPSTETNIRKVKLLELILTMKNKEDTFSVYEVEIEELLP